MIVDLLRIGRPLPTLRLAALGLAAASILSHAAPAHAVQLMPHRAVYDLSLADVGASGGIDAATGRLVFELTGSACDGFAMNTRFVLKTALSTGQDILNDFQSTTYEDPDSRVFRFISRDFVDNDLSEEIEGRAIRAESEITVSLTKPEERAAAVDQKALFPIEHIIALIESAEAESQIFQAPLYDGTEGGEKVYATTAVIGRPIAPGEGTEVEPADTALPDASRWPVSMSYFDDSVMTGGEQTPIYQMSFELYGNGVTRTLKLDYGQFQLDGNLTSLELFEIDPCN